MEQHLETNMKFLCVTALQKLVVFHKLGGVLNLSPTALPPCTDNGVTRKHTHRQNDVHTDTRKEGESVQWAPSHWFNSEPEE